jgi:hypothetical protein
MLTSADRLMPAHGAGSLDHAPDFLARVSHASVFSYERLYTEIGKPFSAMFRARFCIQDGALMDTRQATTATFAVASAARPHLPHDREPHQPNP